MKKDENNNLRRDTFIIYRSFYEAMQSFDDDVRLKLFDAMCEFSLNGEDIELEGIAAAFFMLIRPNLEANNKRYLNGSKAKRKQNRSKTEAKPKQDGSKDEANKDKDNDKDKDKEKEKSDLRKRKMLAFDSFWQTYGLKQDRKKCMNKFLKLSEQDISDIDAYLKNVYFPHLKQNTWQKKRNPLTFLNSEDWKQGEKIEAQGTSQSMYETEIINGQEYELRICPNDPFETRQRRRLGDQSWAIDTNYEQRKGKAKSEM